MGEVEFLEQEHD